MAHVQQQIIDALQALVIAGATVAGDSVYVDRMDPIPKGRDAAVLVEESDNGDDVQQGDIRDMQIRSLEVIVACVLREGDDVAARARDFGLAVEKLVSPKGGDLATVCKDWALVNSRLVRSGEGETALASRVLTYRFTYYVRKGAPDVAI